MAARRISYTAIASFRSELRVVRSLTRLKQLVSSDLAIRKITIARLAVMQKNNKTFYDLISKRKSCELW